MTREGDTVRFRLSDIYLPTTEELQIALPQEAELEGTIVDFSDSGSKPRAFAVVAVSRKQTVIVPVVMLQMISPGRSEDAP